MPIDLSKLVHEEDFLLGTASLGKLRVGALSLEAMGRLGKKFPKPTDGNDEDYVRFLVSVLAYRAIPDTISYGPLVTEEEANGLSIAELDTFSEALLKRDSLFHDFANPKRTEKSGEDGKTVVSYTHPKLEIPQEPGEDVKHYLRRVVEQSVRSYSEYTKKLFQRMMPKRLVSEEMLKLFEQNQRFARKLGESLEIRKLVDSAREMQDAMRGSSDVVKKIAESHEAMRNVLRNTPFDDLASRRYEAPEQPGQYVPPHQPPPIIENPIHETNRQIQALGERVEDLTEELSERVESLTPIVLNSAELLNSMNNLGITMAGASVTHSDRTTKQNQAMILIAAISLLASAFIAGWGFVRDRAEERERVAMLKQLSESIESSRKASEKLQGAMDVRLREVIDTQRAVAAEIKATRQTAAKKGKK